MSWGLTESERYWLERERRQRELERQAKAAAARKAAVRARALDPATRAGRRRIEAATRQRIIALEDRGFRATDQTLAGRQLRRLRAGLNAAGAKVPPQPATRPVEHVTVPARVVLR